MHRHLLILLFCIFSLISIGQKEEPLIVYKCDPPREEIMIFSEYPPALKMKVKDLEKLLTSSVSNPNSIKNSSFVIYVRVIINCDSSATYELPDKNYKIDQLELAHQIVEVLKSHCNWSPAKSKIELTKKILKRERGKIVSYDQYTYYLTRFELGLKFKIQDGSIKLENKINTTERACSRAIRSDVVRQHVGVTKHGNEI